MLNKNESQFTELQLVEIDQNKFAIELNKSNISINLSKMAMPFGKSKKPAFWLRSKEAKEYLDSLSELQKCNSADFLLVRKGGAPDEQGTWANDYRIAMRFAQWLSPEFAIKVDEMLINQLLNRQPLPAVIPKQEPTRKDDELFISKLTNITIKGIYRDGVPFYEISKISNYLRWQNRGSYIALKLAADGECIKVVVAGNDKKSWFINFKGMENVFSRSINLGKIEYEKVKNVYRLYGKEDSIQSSQQLSFFNDSKEKNYKAYDYQFTGVQMLDIISKLNRFNLPELKQELMSELLNGRAE